MREVSVYALDRKRVVRPTVCTTPTTLLTKLFCVTDRLCYICTTCITPRMWHSDLKVMTPQNVTINHY